MATPKAIAAGRDLRVEQQLSAALRTAVRTVQTAEELIGQVTHNFPDLIVADVELEGSLRVIPELRRVNPTAKVLLITSKPAEQQLAELLEPGMVDILRSPYSPAELSLRLATFALGPTQTAARAPTPEDLLAELHNPKSGRVDATCVAEAFGLSERALARALNRSPQAINKTPSAESLQPLLAPFHRSYELLLKIFGSAAPARRWLNSPLADLAGKRPIELMKSGEAEKVRDFLEMMYAGGPT